MWDVTVVEGRPWDLNPEAVVEHPARQGLVDILVQGEQVVREFT